MNVMMIKINGSWVAVGPTVAELENKQAKVGAMGSTTKPVYVSAAGTFSECTAYAGATLLTLNGTAKGGESASIYAPTEAGASGKFIGWDTTGNKPAWKSIADVYQLKGTVATLTDLEAKTATASVGDVWFCTASNTNFAYDGSSAAETGKPEKWSDIGNTIDLSQYLMKYTKDANKVVITDDTANGEIIASTITTTELAVVHDLTGYTIATSESAIATSDTIKTAFGKLQYAMNQRATTTQLTNGSVTKVGTGNVGTSTQLTYLASGTPTAGITFTSGTADPSGGSNGDVYFQYE